MKEERIAILTYHKFPEELWPEQEFQIHKVSLVNGEQVSLQLAERGVRLSNHLWVREVPSPLGKRTPELDFKHRLSL